MLPDEAAVLAGRGGAHAYSERLSRQTMSKIIQRTVCKMSREGCSLNDTETKRFFFFFFFIWILTMTRGMKSPDVQNELKHSLLTRRDSLWVVIFMTWIKSIHDIQLLDVLFCRLQLWYVHVWHFSLNKYRTVHAAWPVLVWFLVHITSYKIIRK